MSMVQQFLAVLLVLALLGAALWLLRRKGVAKIDMKFARRTSGRHLEIIERIALTAHHSLHLVRVDDRTILIGVSPQGCAQLEVVSGQGGEGFTQGGASGRQSREAATELAFWQRTAAGALRGRRRPRACPTVKAEEQARA